MRATKSEMSRSVFLPSFPVITRETPMGLPFGGGQRSGLAPPLDHFTDGGVAGFRSDEQKSGVNVARLSFSSDQRFVFLGVFCAGDVNSSGPSLRQIMEATSTAFSFTLTVTPGSSSLSRAFFSRGRFLGGKRVIKGKRRIFMSTGSEE